MVARAPQIDTVISNFTPRFITSGVPLADFQEATDGLTNWEDWLPRWSARAEIHEEMGREALAVGKGFSAADHLTTAALIYHFAKFMAVQFPDEMRATHAKAVECHRLALPHMDPPGERVAIPFEGHELFGNLRKPVGVENPPVVIMVPGLEATKEEIFGYTPALLARGMATLPIDGPGQGECNFNETWLTKDNYQQAASVVLDWLDGRDDVDSDKIGTMGMSMGSRWGVQVGAHDKRVKAVCGQMANVGTFDMIFEQAQPNFKRIFMYMTGQTDEDEFDEIMKTHDHLPDVAKNLAVPHLLVAGDMDELCAPDDIACFRENLAGASELWLYEGIFHPMGEVSAEIYPAMADWMLTTLNQGRPDGERKTVYIAEGTTLAEHDHG